MSLVRHTVEFKGIVQGVGFRPALHRLASKAGLTGWIQNRSGSVRAAFEGDPSKIASFISQLQSNLPNPAKIETVTVLSTEDLSPAAKSPAFIIRQSEDDQSLDLVVPADLAMCDDCRKEILNRADRRHVYPFTTCTLCGPRYSVITGMPYDRVRTTMNAFPLCPDCRREYEDQSDRRFHAESIACQTCGPSLTLLDSATDVPLREARRLLANGKILALRGIGGFLLAADAFREDALIRLRDRKQRPHKPLAVMARNLSIARRYCHVSEQEESLLTSPAAPIVILDMLAPAANVPRLPAEILAPDSATLGMMLPYSPLHLLLFEQLHDDPVPAFDLLVMTSGNRRSEPICLTTAEAQERLSGIADNILTHNREIALRSDDSLCILQAGQPQVWRRARGYAPAPLHIARQLPCTILGMGAEVKNTIAIGYDRTVVLSPHVGDLETPEAIEGLRNVTSQLPAFLRRTPEIVAVDLHPDMHATIIGRDIARHHNARVHEVQHHHAHAVACLGEHGRDQGLALVFDGTGMGTDNTIWGAELLAVDPAGFRRLATFAGVPLPGGDAAVRQPARQLAGRWLDAGLTPKPDRLAHFGIQPGEFEIWTKMCRDRLNSPVTHSAGRLFDSIAALLGIAPKHITYEGQPAIRMEAAATRAHGKTGPELSFETREQENLLYIDWRRTIVFLSNHDRIQNAQDLLAMSAHVAIAQAAESMVRYALDRGNKGPIALSGGCFMNRILTGLLKTRLEKLGLEVLLHRDLPPNDGCISFGQVLAAGSK